MVALLRLILLTFYFYKTVVFCEDVFFLKICTECLFDPKKGKLSDPFCVECFCDRDCLKYRDCCIDTAIKFDNHLMSTPFNYSCIAPIDGSYQFEHLSKGYGIFMVSEIIQTRQMCSSTKINPVTSVASDITYINLECALANKEYEVLLWNSFKSCKPNNRQCRTILSPPSNVNLRACDQHRASKLINDCEEGFPPYTPDLADKCFKYYSPVYSEDGHVYQNIYCYMCAGGNVGLVKSEEYHPIRALTSFIEEFEPSQTFLKCDQSREFLDAVAGKCRPIICYGDAELVNRTCQNSDLEMHGQQLSVNIFFRDPSRKMVDYIFDFVFYNAMAQISHGFHSTSYSVAVSDSWIEEGTWNIVVKCWFKVEDRLNITTLKTDIYNIGFTSHNTAGIPFNSKIVNNYRPNRTLSLVYQSDEEKDLCCDKFEEYQIKVNEQEFFPVSQQWLCSFIEFQPDEYTLNFPEAYVPHLNLTLGIDKYNVNFWKNLIVCLEDIKDLVAPEILNGTFIIDKVPDENDKIVWYLSIILITASLLCLSASFISYFIIPELLTLPGKINLNLMGWLFIAQSMLLIGIGQTKNVNTCQLIGIIIHYSWLAMLFWMNVCSYNMFKVFVRQNLVNRSNTSHLKQLVKYALYANGVPLLIVVATVTTNLVISSGTKTGYGGIVCYLSSKELIAYCFVIPLLLIITSNSVFFICTVISIYRVKAMRRQTGGDRNNVFIYMKLSIVTGLFWLFSILAEVLNNNALEYTSIVFNGAQGVFLFMAFSVNGKTLSFFRKYLPTFNNTTLSTDSTADSQRKA